MNSTNSSNNDNNSPEPRISEPPRTLKEFLTYLGPAFIFTAAQIGGGELITVPLLGAYFGMTGLFLVPLIAFIKVFGQYYLVQYGVVRGKTFLQETWDRKWLRWLFFGLMIGCIFHSMLLAGLLGQTAGTMEYLIPMSIYFWIIVIMVVAFLIVFTRSYKVLEKSSTIMLWLLIFLIVIVAILFWPSPEQWALGFTPQMPGPVKGLETTSGIMTVAVLFVVLGAGFGPTVSFIWYAKDKQMGMYEATAKGYDLQPEDLTTEERRRLKGWRDIVLYQNLVSAAILSIFSIMIWIAAAQTLYVRNIKPEGWDLIPQMVNIFTLTYGEWSGILFIICGILALFSSIIGPFYGFSRLWEESLERFGIYNRFNIKKETVYRLCLIFFSSLPLIFIFIVARPMWLFSTASILTGPILGLIYIIPIGISYIEMKKHAPELAPNRYWAIALAIISGILMIVLSLLGIS
ncbi:MAG: Nramp family divalent metal transporter [Candidatus Hermodarchaeota archaeon]